MKRLAMVCAAAAWMVGCHGKPAAIGDPPAALGGGAWVRQSVDRPAVDAAPAAVRTYQPRQWIRTEYRNGASSVKLDVFGMPGEASAFEARQKWLGESGTASMNHGELFVIVASVTEPTQGLGRFLRLVESEWLRAPAH